ncbi:hypothetical protein [Streptomyces venezuelae]|uniref:hypothetical protein n=1 Tax=Streptomyces venezuelae TaxID=54571 RepID=UPI0037AA5E6A
MPGEDATTQVERGLTYVCENFDALRAILAEAGQTAALDRLRAAVVDRTGTESSREALDAVDEILRRNEVAHGAYGQAFRSGTWPTTLAGTGEAAKAEVAFLCPLRACRRLEWAERGMREAPTCKVADVTLRSVKR